MNLIAPVTNPELISNLRLSVYEQQDAAEYFEKILRLTRSGASEVKTSSISNLYVK